MYSPHFVTPFFIICHSSSPFLLSPLFPLPFISSLSVAHSLFTPLHHLSLDVSYLMAPTICLCTLTIDSSSTIYALTFLQDYLEVKRLEREVKDADISKVSVCPELSVHCTWRRICIFTCVEMFIYGLSM